MVDGLQAQGIHNIHLWLGASARSLPFGHFYPRQIMRGVDIAGFPAAVGGLTFEVSTIPAAGRVEDHLALGLFTAGVRGDPYCAASERVAGRGGGGRGGCRVEGGEGIGGLGWIGP